MSVETYPFPRSSVIATARYDGAGSVLEIDFRSGANYRYFAVPRAIVDGFVAAPSAGRYFMEHIRDHYPSERTGQRTS
jgi:hypothetical protein